MTEKVKVFQYSVPPTTSVKINLLLNLPSVYAYSRHSEDTSEQTYMSCVPSWDSTLNAGEI